jgi:serine/threonine-protein kinase
VGAVLDERYRLEALIGEGGMGAVFRATHLQMERRVAVKLLKRHLASDDTQLQRFAREARATLRVDSPHAVKVLDFGITPQRDYYMVLEYLDGRTAQRELDVDGPFTPRRAIHIARQALHALGAAHRSGLVHRDIKPDNLLLMRVGADPDSTKVLDFGVAKLMEGAARSARSALALTQHGMVFGTPEFMSPEQACGLPLDGRSDLYSLAVTLFAMLTGCGMFAASSALEWLTCHARTAPPHLTDARPELAPYRELDAVLQRCLAKSREHRPRDAAELDRELERVAATLPGEDGPPASPRPAVHFSASSYLAALESPGTAADAAATLAPPQREGAAGGDRAAAPAARAQSDTGAAAPDPLAAQARRAHAAAPTPRRLAVGVGAVAAVVIAGVSAGLALTPAARRPASPSAASPAPPAAPGPAPAAAQARGAPAPGAAGSGSGGPATAPAAAGLPPPAAQAPGTRPRPASSGGPRRRVDHHLAQAAAARAAGLPIEYLFHAEAAYRAEPRHPRARLIYADALLRTGNREEACAHLRALRTVPDASARAAAAGCPSD